MSERIAALESSGAGDNRDLRVIERYIARAEEKLFRFQRDRVSWTQPRIRLEMTVDTDVE